MRTNIFKLGKLDKLEQGFLAGIVTSAVALGVTLLTLGAVRRVRTRTLMLKSKPLGIDSVPPNTESLGAQPAPEGNTAGARLESESEMNDVMLPSQRW